jgi:hypothetical protein
MQEVSEQEGNSGEERGRPVTDVAAVWGIALTAVHCVHCGEAHLVPSAGLSVGGTSEAEGDAISLRCPFCFQAAATPQPVELREEPPEQILPYGVSGTKLAGILDRWTRGIRFRPDELKAKVLMQRMQRYLVPLWLVDGRVKAVWRADVGFDYQAVSYQDRYSEARGWRSREVTEARSRWEPRVGRLDRTYENLVAPALEDHRALMDRLGDFDLGQRVAYSPEAVAAAAVRIPSLEPQAAWPGAETAFVRAAEEECQQAAGANHIRDFTLQAEYDDLNWTLLLLPAYATWYREGERIWPLLVNGQSGRVSGVRRASVRKANVTSLVLGAIGLLLFVLGGLLALLGAALPPVAVVGGVMLVVGLLMAVAAPIPAIGVWAFNRRSWSDDRR